MKLIIKSRDIDKKNFLNNMIGWFINPFFPFSNNIIFPRDNFIQIFYR